MSQHAVWPSPARRARPWTWVCVAAQHGWLLASSLGLGVGPTLTAWPPSATKVVSHLIEKLPGSVGEKCPPADVLVNIIAVLNNLVVVSPVAARDLLYFDGLRKLVFIKKKRDR